MRVPSGLNEALLTLSAWQPDLELGVGGNGAHAPEFAGGWKNLTRRRTVSRCLKIPPAGCKLRVKESP